MPRLLVDREGFRIVHTEVASGPHGEIQDVYTLERRKGENAMGDPHWEFVKVESTPLVKLLVAEIIDNALAKEQA